MAFPTIYIKEAYRTKKPYIIPYKYELLNMIFNMCWGIEFYWDKDPIKWAIMVSNILSFGVCLGVSIVFFVVHFNALNSTLFVFLFIGSLFGFFMGAREIKLIPDMSYYCFIVSFLHTLSNITIMFRLIMIGKNRDKESRINDLPLWVIAIFCASTFCWCIFILSCFSFVSSSLSYTAFFIPNIVGFIESGIAFSFAISWLIVPPRNNLRKLQNPKFKSKNQPPIEKAVETEAPLNANNERTDSIELKDDKNQQLNIKDNHDFNQEDANQIKNILEQGADSNSADIESEKNAKIEKSEIHTKMTVQNFMSVSNVVIERNDDSPNMSNSGEISEADSNTHENVQRSTQVMMALDKK